jgi:hypothetical protein
VICHEQTKRVINHPANPSSSISRHWHDGQRTSKALGLIRRNPQNAPRGLLRQALRGKHHASCVSGCKAGADMTRESDFTGEQQDLILDNLPVIGINKTAELLGVSDLKLRWWIQYERRKGACIKVKKMTGLRKDSA